jgi:microcystin-dependent protein
LHLAFVIASGAVPQLLNHQGRIAVNGTNFEGTGRFKFALVNTNGSTTYWSNDGTSTAGSQPTAAVTLTVAKGLYALALGDTTLTNMTAATATTRMAAASRQSPAFPPLPHHLRQRGMATQGSSPKPPHCNLPQIPPR